MSNSLINQPIFLKIWTLLTRKEQIRAIALLGLMIIGTLLETLSVGLVIPALTLMMQNDLSSNFLGVSSALTYFRASSHGDAVRIALAILIGAYLIKTLFLTMLTWYQMKFAFGIQRDLSVRIYEKYLNKPYEFFFKKNTADLISIAINEVNLFVGNGVLPAISFATELLVISALGFLIFLIEPYGSLVLIGSYGALIFLLVIFTKKRMSTWGQVRQKEEMLRLKLMQEGLGGIKEVKVFGREQFFLDSYSKHNHEAASVAQSQGTLQKLPGLWIEFMAVCGLLGLVLILSFQHQSIATVIPTLGLFASAAFRLMPSVNRILSAQHAMHYVTPILNALQIELSGFHGERVLFQNNCIEFKEEIRFENISFSYAENACPAIKNLSLVIKKGESIGLLGESGSGKSTFVDILLGLLIPERGRMLIDGKNIDKNLRGWANQIGYVPQFIYLTDDSLRNNIAFGISHAEINDEQLFEAIRASQLEEFIGTLPAGIETQVGERGIRLSGGQRQRIGIARALYHNPEILVLDEATSALDGKTEEEVMGAVNTLHGRKTIITIAHRLSTLKGCDRVFRVNGGHFLEISKGEIRFD